MNDNKHIPSLVLSDWTPRQVFQGTLVVVAVLAGFWLLYVGRLAVFSLFTAIVIRTAIAPAVDWLHKRGVPVGVGIVAIYLIMVAGLAGVGLLFVPLLTVQGANILSSFGGLYARVLTALQHSSSYVLNQLGAQLPLSLAPVPQAGADGASRLEALLGGLSYLGLLGDSLFTIVAVLLLAFYWTLDRDRVVRWLLLFVAAEQREQARDLFLASEAKVGGYIRGVALLSLIVGGLAFAAYLAMGLPFALLLAIMAGLLEAVPVIGPALGSIPALIVALSVSPGLIVWVLVAHTAIQLLENYVLAPRVMAHTVGVNPVVTLLSLLAFGSLFGLTGALMAIPIAAVVQLLVDRYVLQVEGEAAPAPAGRDRLSVLRYDAEELVRDVRNQWRSQDEALPAEGSNVVEETVEALAADLDALLETAGSNDAATP